MRGGKDRAAEEISRELGQGQQELLVFEGPSGGNWRIQFDAIGPCRKEKSKDRGHLKEEKGWHATKGKHSRLRRGRGPAIRGVLKE